MTTDTLTNTQTSYDPSTKIWSGNKTSYPYASDIFLGSVLIECLQKNPDHINQICCDTGIHYTNREILEKSISVSIHFKKLGFVQDGVVGICATNSDFLAPLVIGALANGLVINALDVSLAKEGIKHMFSVTTPAIVFCDGVIYDRVKESCTEIDSKAVVYTLADHITGVPNIKEFLTETFVTEDFRPIPLEKNSHEQNAFILCSSGTTGLSKGVIVTHASLLNINLDKFFKSNENILCFSSLYWGSGIFCLLSGIQNDLPRLITRKSFSSELFLDLVEKYKATLVFSPPGQMARLAASPTIHERDLSSVKCYILGGSDISTTLVKKIKPFSKQAGIIVGYGMSEIPGFNITAGFVSENGSTGKLGPNIKLKIIDDEGKSLGPNESGEILVSSTLIPFAGYYRNPEATTQCCDKEGWIHSGDIGYMNENNELHVVDRKKEIIKYIGYQFSPSEIESVIIELPDVAEVCVAGIPDDFYTFLPAAMVVLKSNSSLKEADVKEYVAEKMDDFKQLRGGVYFVNEIPKTPSGKNLRRKVIEMCLNLRGELKN